MQRRKFLIGAGSLAAAGAAALGTGAVDTISAQRGMAVDVAGDQEAYLGMIPNTDSDFVNYDGGTISLDFGFTSDSGGEGVNKAGYTEARPAFTLRNQAKSTMYVSMRNSLKNINISNGDSHNTGWTGSNAQVPAGFDFQFVVADDVPEVSTDSVGLIDRDTAPQSTGGNFGAAYDPTKVSQSPGGMNAYRWIDGDDHCGCVELGAGDEVPVIARAVVTPNFDLSGMTVPDIAFQAEAVDNKSDAQYSTNVTNNLSLGL